MDIEKSIEKFKRQITVGKCEKNIGIPVYISDLETLLTAYEKEKEKNKNARDMIEYYLIENNSLNDFDKRNKELRKLEKVLEE